MLGEAGREIRLNRRNVCVRDFDNADAEKAMTLGSIRIHE
jgi:hypothetical protein